MNEKVLRAPDITLNIFRSCFEKMLSKEDFARATAIFEQTQFANARGIATQLYIATQTDKLSDVLGAYERLIDPSSFLAQVEDPVRRAVEVREFKDMVYGSIITEHGSGPTELLELMEDIEVPKIFDLMSS